jgi:hypothetical protein
MEVREVAALTSLQTDDFGAHRVVAPREITEVCRTPSLLWPAKLSYGHNHSFRHHQQAEKEELEELSAGRRAQPSVFTY